MKKRLIALLAIAALSITSIPVLAVPAEDEKAILSIDYFGLVDTSIVSPDNVVLNPNIRNGDTGKIAWIGVAVEKAENLTGYFTDDGLYSMELAFDYDPRYIEPYLVDNKDQWIECLKRYNIATENAGGGSRFYWHEDSVEFDLTACIPDADVIYDEYSEAESDPNHKMMFISMAGKPDGSHFRLQGVTSTGEGEKIYLIRLPFLIKGIPPPGTPNALCMNLGTETFILTSGVGGHEKYGAWEAEDKTSPEVNLKNYFVWQNNFDIFKRSEDSALTDIKIFQYIPPDAEDPSGTAKPKEYTLFHKKTLGEGDEGGDVDKDFSATQFEYFTAVDDDVGSVVLQLFPDVESNVTVEFSNDDNLAPVSIKVESDAAGNCTNTDPIGTLIQVNPDNVDTDSGFNNLITISIGMDIYNIHIRRYRKPEIVLNYGNSPYGLIMQMEEQPDGTWNDAYKQAAKDDFINGSSVTRNTFKTAQYTPTGVSADSGIKYTLQAWGLTELTDNTDEEKNKVNMDRNDYAIFVYERTNFRDPGFKAINGMGKEVDPLTDDSTTDALKPVITREISFRRLTGDGQNIEDASSDDETVTVTGQPTDYLFFQITSREKASNGSYLKRPVRPDIYYMNYSFEDPYTKKTAMAIRPVIVLSMLGDANFDESINAGDLSVVNSAEKNGSITISQTAMPMTAWNIFVYRVLDNSTDGSVNAGDASMINTAERAMQNPDIRFYPFLPQS